MMDMTALLDEIRRSSDCMVLPPSGLPAVPFIPVDMADFYRECGGVKLYPSKDYGIDILPPYRVKRAVEVVFPGLSLAEVEATKDNISFDWYVIADGGDGQTVSIDLHPDRFGRCYDTFWDRFATPGETPIIAASFTELIVRLYENSGSYWFWLRNDFVGHGDAYD